MTAHFFANVLSSYLSICGIGLLTLSVVLLTRTARLLLGRRARGTITSYAPRMRERIGRAQHFMPVFRFHHPRFGDLEVQSRVGSTRPDRLPVNSEVIIAFDQQRPLAEIAGYRLWVGPMSFLILGIGTLFAAWTAAP